MSKNPTRILQDHERLSRKSKMQKFKKSKRSQEMKIIIQKQLFAQNLGKILKKRYKKWLENFHKQHLQAMVLFAGLESNVDIFLFYAIIPLDSFQLPSVSQPISVEFRGEPADKWTVSGGTSHCILVVSVEIVVPHHDSSRGQSVPNFGCTCWAVSVIDESYVKRPCKSTSITCTLDISSL